MTRQDLPTPYFFILDTPLLIYNGRLIQPKELTTEDDNYAEFNLRKYSLEEIVASKKLEELYLRHNKELIEQLQESFIRRYFHQEFRSREYISENLRRNKALSLIVEKIL